jgi:hypothetical protein
MDIWPMFRVVIQIKLDLNKIELVNNSDPFCLAPNTLAIKNFDLL